ncbi:MAG: MBL fold metallo-hydrolase [Methanoregula sp.]|nr:MAG: MBL fold metallo-hydrolase [Methanoregula sp.]
MPDIPGALHRAAAICRKYGSNINRLQYDRRIDPATVFFEVTTDTGSFKKITEELGRIGYLQTSIKPVSFLKFYAYLPHRSGSLDEFLGYTTNAGANIALIDFDDTGRHPERLTVSLNVEQSDEVDQLMDNLKSRYRLEILDYDNSGRQLDDTIFYVKFAQNIRNLIGEAEDSFLLSFLADTNHIAQELTGRGNDPKKVFGSVLATGQTLHATTGVCFYADVQQFCITPDVNLLCFQMPCGGNIFVFSAADELVMVDTGYGIYYPDVTRMFTYYGLNDGRPLSRIIVTHADADHCGASGYFKVPVYLHSATIEIIRQNNRAYGSRSERSILEAFYTNMINVFSKFTSPVNIHPFHLPEKSVRGIFPILETLRIGDLDLEVLESPGGHLCGQIYLYSKEQGLLLAADSIINFASLTPERSAYNALANFLVTSVNVDSELARTERKELFDLISATDAALRPQKKRCIVCGGHGAVSVYNEGKMVTYGEVEHYGAVVPET